MRDIYFSLHKKGPHSGPLVLFWFCDLRGHAGYWRYLYADFWG